MSTSFSISGRVKVAQTDFAGKMHFAEFFKDMEECLHEYLRSLGVSVDYTKTGYAWPRVEANCKYMRPLTFDDEYEVEVVIAQVADKVVNASFTFHRTGVDEPVATGSLVVACCQEDVDGKLRAVPIPEEIRSKLSP